MKRPRFAPVLAAALGSLVAFAAAGRAQVEGEPEAPASQLAVEAIEVEPEQPGADTLCRLRVRLRNAGERDAAALGFTVRINGQDLAVYRNQLFYQAIPAGGAATVELYNFWTTETLRPPPADGKLKLEVALREAQWMQIGDDEEGVEVWQPLGEVAGLPVGSERTLELRRPGAGAG